MGGVTGKERCRAASPEPEELDNVIEGHMSPLEQGGVAITTPVATQVVSLLWQ
ncbi:unnamed protein product, partial [Staurois parvus]